MEQQLYRKESVERVSSPEVLNDYLHVTSPAMWAVLAAVVLLLAGLFVWSSVTAVESYAAGEAEVRGGVQAAQSAEAEQPAQATQSAQSKPLATPGDIEETEWTEGKLSPTEALRAARDGYTGTVSDRQELHGEDFLSQAANTMTEEEYNRAMADAIVDEYHGKEYRLHFSAGEEVKFLVITPLYSPKAEGDAEIMLMLKDAGEGFAIGEDVNPVSVTIYDTDEPEPVYVSMAAETVYAENGKATVTVKREGRINAIKGVYLSSWGGSAVEGDEYSGIGAKLYFPMGITSRSVDMNSKSGDQIQVDYVAFFPDEAGAKAFRANDGYTTTPGAYTYHVGDVLTFATELTDAGEDAHMAPSGFYFEHHVASRNGILLNYNTEPYINDKTNNGTKIYKLRGEDTGGETVDRNYYFEPVFTQEKNRISVVISEDYYNRYIDTTKGIFQKGNYVRIDHDRANRQYTVVVDEDILTNEIYELTACTKRPDSVVAKWITADGKEYFGDTFYHMSKSRIKDNVITLEAAAGSHLTYVTLQGTVTTSTFNLSTERSATDSWPVENALVSYGTSAGWTDENGRFNLPAAFLYDSDAAIRFTVTYNGVTTIQEAKVPTNKAAKHAAVTLAGKAVQAVTADAGVLKVASYTDRVAHVDRVEAKQAGMITGGVNGLTMNGKRLHVEVYIAQGEDYVLNGKTYSEHVKDVTLFFKDQLTGELHGVYSSNVPASQQGSVVKWSYNDAKGLFTLDINSFDKEHPTEWTYGDVLMVSITTDRKSGFSAFTENQGQKWLYDMEKDEYVAVDVDSSENLLMRYLPVSSGLGVYADPNYKPQTFQYDIENIPDMLQIEPATDEDGELLDGDKRYSFGAYPYIGEITAAVHVFQKVVSSAFLSEEARMIQEDLADLAGDGVDVIATGPSVNDGAHKQDTGFGLSVFFNTTETFYGGVRFMLGVIMTYGGGQGYKSQKNPYSSTQRALDHFLYPKQQGEQVGPTSDQLGIIDRNDVMATTGREKQQKMLSEFGGGYFKVMAYLGFYLDYGYIEISKDGGAQVSHDMVFMGAGGFVGFNFSGGYTWPFLFAFIPGYFNVDAGIGVTFFLGAEANPQRTLQSFQNQKEMHGQDFSFNFEVDGNIYVTGTIGVGIYKLVGARVSAGVGFEFGYSNNVTEWWPELHGHLHRGVR